MEPNRDVMTIDRDEPRAVQSPPSGTVMSPMDLIQTAIERGASLEQLQQMMDFKDRLDTQAARKAFDAAMSEAKGKIPPILKTRTVDYKTDKGRTHYKHEDLASIAQVVDPILAAHGLSYRYRTTQGDGGVAVTCIVAHRDGHVEENTLRAGADTSGGKNGVQGIGSTITYLQRYTLKAALGLAAAPDDDGKASAAPEKAPEPISQAQLDELRDLIDEVGADTPALCKYLQVNALRDIPAKEFGKVKAIVNRKREKANA